MSERNNTVHAIQVTAVNECAAFVISTLKRKRDTDDETVDQEQEQELKNGLNAIIGSALLKTAADVHDTVHKPSKAVVKAGKRALRLSNNVLRYNRYLERVIKRARRDLNVVSDSDSDTAYDHRPVDCVAPKYVKEGEKSDDEDVCLNPE